MIIIDVVIEMHSSGGPIKLTPALPPGRGVNNIIMSERAREVGQVWKTTTAVAPRVLKG